MGFTAITTLWVHRLMPNRLFFGFSPIHLFSALTLFGVVSALIGGNAHNVPQHHASMLGVYIGSIFFAGSLTFLPGRIMHGVVSVIDRYGVSQFRAIRCAAAADATGGTIVALQSSNLSTRRGRAPFRSKSVQKRFSARARKWTSSQRRRSRPRRS